MFKQKSLAKKTGFLFLIMAGLFLANINFVEAAEWAPITDLSSMGIAADDTVSLSDFIIVIYDFLLSAVGIAAMFMIVVGGFRYLTAAGNAAALSEAKDIIYSALYGLLLALCVWIIVSTINPDLVYLKQPGADPTHGDYSCAPAGTACNTCTAYDGCSTSVCVGGDPDCPDAVAGADCDPNNGCKSGCTPPDTDCNYSINCCYKDCGDILPEECPTWTGCTDPTIGTAIDGKCTCLDGEKEPIIIGDDCNETCRTTGHCGWNFLVVRVNTDGIKEGTDDTLSWSSANKYWELDSDKTQIWDFFLTNKGTWGAFDITVDSYAPAAITYECAILVTSRRTTTIGPLTMTGDYRNIFWVEEGAAIKKDGFSLERDVDGKYHQCCEQNLGANPACKLDHILTVPGCDWGNPGTGSPPSMHCAEELFKARYTNKVINRCDNKESDTDNERSCSSAVSSFTDTMYYPNRDITCDPATGMWR